MNTLPSNILSFVVVELEIFCTLFKSNPVCHCMIYHHFCSRKVDVNNPIDDSFLPAASSNPGVDEWSLFMQEQQKASQKKTKKPG